MDAVMLSRLQFAVAVFFHFIFVPLTLGLSLLIAWMETKYVRTNDETWLKHTKFWGKLFLINFTLGVVTGITLEFQFGTNWSRYSEYVGDIFGALLAIEATVAFFMESTFLAVWHFGWKKLGKKAHCVCAWLVFIASNLSALWIIFANGFMQHPTGYVLRNGRAELESFFDVITNPYAWGMYAHTLLTAWMLAAFFVLGVSAWHMRRSAHGGFFRNSFRFAAPIALVLAILIGISGDVVGQNVAKMQPAKLAAMEGHWETRSNVPFYLLQVPSEAAEENSVEAIGIPGLLSFLSYHDFNAEVKGLKDFPKEDRPPVAATFWTFRLMVALGGLFILVALWSFTQRNRETPNPRLMSILPWMIPLPYFAIAFGWAVAEIGRQPWIVYNLMRTSDAVSPVPADNILFSLVGFAVVYTLLGILDIYLLIKYARKGPEGV
ncbi:MAG: cytochrome ubiquinol oxidase subunit I [Desulfovibrionaceae bacterium]|nr:cytochrome ubiquinol oxidase subunit I [Desulfovibrionaceae bacterium]